MQVGVTVICTTFNHEKYIAQALESFVEQKTSFPFRVIVHDDASTDGTADIVREYEAKYPDIILGVYQSENLYSRGIPCVGFITPHIQSEYVAFCEGDDYWTDNTKLQKQYDALESQKSCDFCTHRVCEVNEKGEANGATYPSFERDSGEIDSRSFIKLCEQYSFQTSSFFARAAQWVKYVSDPPEFRTVSSVGDVCTLLYFGQLANVYYIDETMSCYRRGVAGAWSMVQGNPRNIEKHITHLDKMILTMQKYNEYTGNRYAAELERRTAQFYYTRCIISKSARKFLREPESRILHALSLNKKIIFALAVVLPNVTFKLHQRRYEKRKNKWR